MTWILTETDFDPQSQHHKETIFTIGNGYLATRGAFEEGYPGDERATFVHGVFDDVPIVFTELANAPDWLMVAIRLNGERFAMNLGRVEHYQRSLDLQTGVLTRTVSWVSPSGLSADITFERFASLADPHTLLIRCQVIPHFNGTAEFRCGFNGNTENEMIAHWRWIAQGNQDNTAYLHNRTRRTAIDYVSAMRVSPVSGQILSTDFWDVENSPTFNLKLVAETGKALVIEKHIAVATSRDDPDPLELALEHLQGVSDWNTALEANRQVWQSEWERVDVLVEGDEEAQLALRFSLYQLLIAAPRQDNCVNIGAKTLSGFGYRGHSFWDTEIFMLPFFTFTSPQIAENLLHYRYARLDGAHRKALDNGYEGAQFPWESADTGLEVTPTWVPHWSDPKEVIRIWTGDIEIHISADIAYAVHQFWQVTGKDDWLADYGAEIILDTAKFWASRAEWDAAKARYGFSDVIGPDEYHDHIDNNVYTNRMAQWNLQTALDVLAWLDRCYPKKAAELRAKLDLSEERLAHWREVIEKMYLPMDPSGLIEQFEGYFARKDVNLASLEPRSISVQMLYGIEECNATQVLKQPDVLMLQYLLRRHYSDEEVQANYDYYTPRTDHTYGSSLGPSIQTIMACEIGCVDDAYEHFIRTARADLRNIRGNAEDGIHAASAGGAWLALVFGFAGLRLNDSGWEIRPRLPKHWKRVQFRFTYHGKPQFVEITNP